jgi:hypothetical protein
MYQSPLLFFFGTSNHMSSFLYVTPRSEEEVMEFFDSINGDGNFRKTASSYGLLKVDATLAHCLRTQNCSPSDGTWHIACQTCSPPSRLWVEPMALPKYRVQCHQRSLVLLLPLQWWPFLPLPLPLLLLLHLLTKNQEACVVSC